MGIGSGAGVIDSGIGIGAGMGTGAGAGSSVGMGCGFEGAGRTGREGGIWLSTVRGIGCGAAVGLLAVCCGTLATWFGLPGMFITTTSATIASRAKAPPPPTSNIT
jgi:hypothetical protein